MSEQKPGDVGIDNHQEALSVWLDLFRWLAAFAVVLTHVSHRLFVRYGDLPHEAKSPLYYLVGGVSSFGEPAVMIFFVLSGFLVGGGSLRRYRRTGQFRADDYMLARLSRLWVVLIPTFLLTFLLNHLGGGFFGGFERGVYDISTQDGLTGYRQDPIVFVCNAAFLQTAFCNQYGGNGALWSLFNEFWYYVAWPFVMLALWSKAPVRHRLGLAAVAVIGLIFLAANQFVGANIALYFLLWLIGTVAADRVRPLLPMPPLAAAALLVVFLAFWRVFAGGETAGDNVLVQFPSDLVMALLFANLIMTMKAAKRLPYPPLRRIHQLIAGFSFTLYCVHTPVINCFGAFLMWSLGYGWHMLPVGAVPYLLYAAAVALCLLVAYLMSLATERHTLATRRWAERHWHRLVRSRPRTIS